MIEVILLSVWFAIPFALVFRKMGRSGWWSLIGLIPLGFAALPWMAAFMRLKRGPSVETISEVFR
jgi:hypothetical protein